MKYEIAERVVVDTSHHAGGRVRLELDAGVHETSNPVYIDVVEQLLVPRKLATAVATKRRKKKTEE